MKRNRQDQGGIVIFAHVPPPHHGQSHMVQLMLKGLATQPGVFHVDARVSDGIADVGGIRPIKFFRLIRYCWHAAGYRIFRGAKVLYYIPAPPKRSAIARDVFALALLRPFFSRIILHWHAVGLGAWAQGGGLGQILIRRLLAGADPAIVIARGNAADAEVFRPRSLAFVPNGIPDPCPDFEQQSDTRTQRSLRVQTWIVGSAQSNAGDRIHVLYLGHCTRSKGLFDALEAMRKAAEYCGRLNWRFSIAGDFLSQGERSEAESAAGFLEDLGVEVAWLGFLCGTDKIRCYLQNDILVFPSHSESFGLVAVEAFACGLPVIGTDIPGLRAVFGDTPCARVPIGDPHAIALSLLSPSSYADPNVLRSRYAAEFTLEKFQSRISSVLSFRLGEQPDLHDVEA